jgi:hypothetical protein
MSAVFSIKQAQEMAADLRQFWPEMYAEVWQAFQSAAVGAQQEVVFFRKLLAEFQTRFTSFAAGHLQINCRTAQVHQKPIVKTNQFRCELADLLVVVKFRAASGVAEKKSILYQVKMCKAGTFQATIDQHQLDLLTKWPQFQFGRKANGTAEIFSIQPRTIEFGSYLIAQRSPKQHQWLPRPIFPWFCYPCYGVAPSALTVQREGPKRVNCDSISEPCSDVCNMIRHLVFDLGEPHFFNPEVQRLVGSLYRYVGLSPDPPKEFDGYTKEISRDDIGFGVVEFSVSTGQKR